MTAPVFSLGVLAEQLGATLRGASDIPVCGLASLQEAEADQLSFLANPQYRKHLPACRAAAVLLTEADAEGYAGNALIVANPYLAYALLIYAGLYGISHKLALPPASDFNLYTAPAQILQTLQALPDSLGEAIALAETSPFVRAHLPESVLCAFGVK